MIISKTPLRISFFGGGTDYPAYYDDNLGIVLGTTINKYVYISINKLSPFFDHKIRIGYSKTELIKDVDNIIHPSVRECLKFQKIDGNLDIHIFSDLPAKTGLGSSSSFTVGFLNALYAFKGKKISKKRLATEACYVEQHLIKENVGSQDQFHAAYGGLNIIEFNSSNIRARPLIISSEKKSILENHLMIFYTGLTRFASKVVKEQITNTINKKNDSHLKIMKEMVFEAEDIISKVKNDELISKLGKLLDDSWEMKKKLSSKITNPIIDVAYEKAKNNGAYGGKLCGAGSGGFLALLAPIDKKKDIKKALANFLEVDFSFENEGSSIIYMEH